MATHSFQIYPSPRKNQRFPNTRRPSFSFVSKATGRLLNGVGINVLPHAVEDPSPLPPGLRQDSMPSHVAVIMDGNRRWARMRGLPAGSGYEAGSRALRRLVDLCCKWRIRVLTVFAFSSDNWVRPKVLLSEAAETTKNNSQLHLILAVNYSGQNDLVQACQNIALKVKEGLIEPKDINECLLASELETNCTEFPSPDLLIRTSGELRISNFMLWQLAYTELYFANSLWPDFGEEEFVKALCSFQQRQRRYGGKSC